MKFHNRFNVHVDLMVWYCLARYIKKGEDSSGLSFDQIREVET
ncbi:hypothetical protein [Flavobacterium ginsengisoli]